MSKVILKRSASLRNDKRQARPDDKVITLENIEGWTGRLRSYTDPAHVSGELVLFKKGDVLFNKLRPYLAKVHLASEDGLATSEMLILKPDVSKLLPSYLFYKMISPDTISEVNNATYGVKMPRANWDIVGALDISTAPDIDKQEAIAKYLDGKTQTLDKMLATKNHTLTYVSELRRAIITSAVLGNGGVYASLQTTNIPWIGKIPAHWRVEKIKGVADIVLGKMLLSVEKEGYLSKPYLRAQNIRWEKVDISDVNEMWFSPNEISQYRLKKGDILVSEGGEVGRAAMWRDELAECYIQNSVNRLRVKKKKILPEYLLYVLESYGQAKVFMNTVNRVSIAHLTREKLKEYAIPLPPVDEQREIVANLQQRLSKIDQTDKALQKSISQLKEYRSSLIANVIDGKVKV